MYSRRRCSFSLISVAAFLLTCCVTSVADTELPRATTGVQYAVQLGVNVAGVHPVFISPLHIAVEGDLPPGLKLDADCLLEGVVAGKSGGDYAFVLVVTDARGTQIRSRFRMHVGAKPQLIVVGGENTAGLQPAPAGALPPAPSSVATPAPSIQIARARPTQVNRAEREANVSSAPVKVVAAVPRKAVPAEVPADPPDPQGGGTCPPAATYR